MGAVRIGLRLCSLLGATHQPICFRQVPVPAGQAQVLHSCPSSLGRATHRSNFAAVATFLSKHAPVENMPALLLQMSLLGRAYCQTLKSCNVTGDRRIAWCRQLRVCRGLDLPSVCKCSRLGLGGSAGAKADQLPLQKASFHSSCSSCPPQPHGSRARRLQPPTSAANESGLPLP